MLRLSALTTDIDTLIVQNTINQMVITYRFKKYPHVVCDDNRTLWQLPHFKNKRTRPLKKLIYNESRRAYRIDSQWISRQKLLEDRYPVKEVFNETVLENLLNSINRKLDVNNNLQLNSVDWLINPKLV